jgi:hypothetical protein
VDEVNEGWFILNLRFYNTHIYLIGLKVIRNILQEITATNSQSVLLKTAT